MNEQNSKKILFNHSTLLSLKAELLRKQEEVQEKKHLPQHKLENFKPAPAKPSEELNQDESKKTFRDSFKAVDTEKLEACKMVKAVLEKKAALYEHLSDKAGNSQLAGHFLVDFNTKKQQESTKNETIVEAEEDHNQNDDGDSEWTEFTDCLGRTRKCLKVDLEVYKEKDKALSRTMSIGGTNSGKTGSDTENDTSGKPEKSFLVQKTNDFLQSLREKWEQKEQEVLSKDKDIHYQDLLYDEARMHGVSYYSFSTDETERRKQMEALIRLREETLRSQRDAEETRKKRDELIAARVAATRARQRALRGLPPEEPQENQKDFNTCLLEFLQKQRVEADAKAAIEEQKVREEIERERQKLRESYVREWDLGKDGVPGEVKGFRELTQEQYVEQQRAKRLDEFAPPQAPSKGKNNYSFDNKGKKFNKIDAPGPSKTWADVRPDVPLEMEAPPPSDISDYVKKGLFFSSKEETMKSQLANKVHNIKYRNFVKAQEPSTIIDELTLGDCEENHHREKNPGSNHEAVAPPPSYDYYGPVPKQRRTQKPFESNLQEAYEQGANSLKSKGRDLNLSKSYDFTFD